MQTGTAEQTMKRGLIPLTTPTPTPSEAAPKHSRLPSKHSQYTKFQPEQPMEPGAGSVTMSTPDEAEMRTYACPVWRKNSENKTRLRLHIRQEHIDYRYPCPNPDCDKSYKDGGALNDHIRRRETPFQLRKPRRPLTCPVIDCKYYDMPFVNYGNLDIHLKNKHSHLGLVAGTKKPRRRTTCPVLGCEYHDKPFA
jgi:hypothetical protein